MRSADRGGDSPLRLRHVRRWTRPRRGRWLAAVIAFHYSLLSMLASGMLLFTATGQPTSAYVIAGVGQPDWWDYPALVVFTPGMLLALPLSLTLAMVLVALGLGVAVAASVNILWERRQTVRSGVPRPPSLPAGAGAAPVVAALVSLGTGCGADFAVGGVALLGTSATATREALRTLSLALGLFDLVVMFGSLLLLESVLRDAEAAIPTDRTHRGRSGRRAHASGTRP